ncbi:MAG: pyruvate kinase [Candidatus Helarchaeota archaeon]
METKRKRITRSKIVCTIGPATQSEEMIKKLIDAGMDLARLNLSHGSHEWHTANFNKIRNISEKIGVILDIQGPKIRLGKIKDDKKYFLKLGDKFTLTSRDIEGNNEIASTTYKKLPSEVKPGNLIYINDGIVGIQVIGIENGTDIKCEVIAGGEISSHKGINVPNVNITAKVPTEKDKEDLELAAKLNPEYLAASFVSSADDVNTIRNILENKGANIPIISKIERPIAIKQFDSILNATDGVMVARGDLGVEMQSENVPILQKEIIRKCNKVGKPVICATQMLDSMQWNPIPTRAEASDVFNAIFDGADAVMLSGETAVGKYPIQSVKMMEKIIINAENSMPPVDLHYYDSKSPTNSEILSHAGMIILREIEHHRKTKLDAIIVVTRSGYTARMISKYRPNVPIFAMTFSKNVFRRLFLFWGVESMYIEQKENLHEITQDAVKNVYNEGYINLDDTILISSGSDLVPHMQTTSISLFNVRDVIYEDKAEG